MNAFRLRYIRQDLSSRPNQDPSFQNNSFTRLIFINDECFLNPFLHIIHRLLLRFRDIFRHIVPRHHHHPRTVFAFGS